VCEDCGAVPPVRIDTHHIDRNKSNNSLENVKVLCVVCHAKRHYLEDTRGLRGELPREKKDILLKENLE
jgi:5-methylcytosine-specific restriction endonuclease McrA